MILQDEDFKMAPRDPERIDRMIELLRQCWKETGPDQRLLQLIINVFPPHVGRDAGQMYNVEDDLTEELLKQFLRKYGKKGTRR